jgi:hypothetical protein
MTVRTHPLLPVRCSSRSPPSILRAILRDSTRHLPWPGMRACTSSALAFMFSRRRQPVSRGGATRHVRDLGSRPPGGAATSAASVGYITRGVPGGQIAVGSMASSAGTAFFRLRRLSLVMTPPCRCSHAMQQLTFPSSWSAPDRSVRPRRAAGTAGHRQPSWRRDGPHRAPGARVIRARSRSSARWASTAAWRGHPRSDGGACLDDHAWHGPGACHTSGRATLALPRS